jgi:hypothetical protein
LTFGGFVVAVMLVVLSASRTKIYWYAVPLYPTLSIIVAIVSNRLMDFLPKRGKREVPWRLWVSLGLAALVTGAAVWAKAVALPKAEDDAQGRYGAVFAELDHAGRRRVRTLDAGVDNDDDLQGYTPQLHFYILAWRARGMDVRSQAHFDRLQPGDVAATCDGRWIDHVQSLGPPLTRVPGCAAALTPKSRPGA